MSFKQQNIIQWFKQPLYTDTKWTFLAMMDYAKQLKEGMIEFKINGYRYFGFEVPFNQHNKKILDLLEIEIKTLDGDKITLTEAVQAYKDYKKRKSNRRK